MNSYIRPLIAGALLCVAHLSASAQTRNEWSMQGSGLYAGLGGSPYSGVKPGGGFEFQARKKLDQFWSLGCGVQGTYHSLKSFEGSEKLEGLFCEPRRLVDVNSEWFFPYFSGRAAILRQHFTSGAVTHSARGFTANLGTGLLMPLIGSTSSYPTLLEIGVSAGYTEFGDFITSKGGITIEKTRPVRRWLELRDSRWTRRRTALGQFAEIVGQTRTRRRRSANSAITCSQTCRQRFNPSTVWSPMWPMRMVVSLSFP